jgi:hypothetical protein
MANQPYLPLYTGDWKKDPQLSMCSPATRGIWVDLLCSFHDSKTGETTGTLEQFSRLCRCNTTSMLSALNELVSTGTANVEQNGELYTVTCRRMKKMAEISAKRAEAGSKGGAKVKQSLENENEYQVPGSGATGKKNPEGGRLCSQKELEDFCVHELGLPRSDGEYLWLHWEENGWKRGKEQVKNWKMAARKWKAGGFFPSQKNFKQKTSPQDFGKL